MKRTNRYQQEFKIRMGTKRCMKTALKKADDNKGWGHRQKIKSQLLIRLYPYKKTAGHNHELINIQCIMMHKY